jgi:GNAT superfamily N-acetyltransferase
MALRLQTRELRWPDAAAALAALDTSVVANRIYALVADESSFAPREAWNRRAILTHLCVDRPRRGVGAGRALVGAAAAFARERGARQLWLERQT